MSQKQSRITKFWQELKRRRVLNVITVYASVAWLLIQLVNNLLVPLNLPTIVSTIVIIALAVGFPLAIILAWMHDLNPEVIVKPKAEGKADGELDGGLEGAEEGLQEEVKVVGPLAWRIATYVSFALIVGLLTLNLAGRSKHLRAGDIQSLLILPFDNFTGDDDLEYVAAGMHASLIGDMGKVSGLRVISKTTASIYKGMNLALPEIASELNADAVVEPTVMCYGDSVCIQIRVITSFPEEKQLWVGEYKEEKSKIMSLYNRVTRQIADEVKIQLTPGEELLLADARTVNSEAYDYYLKGLFNWEQFTGESIQLALEYFTKAIEIDPDWAPPHAGVAYYWIAIRQTGFAPPSITIPQIYENLDKASKLDPNSAFVQYVSALASVWTELNWEKGEKEFLNVLKINPSDALAHLYYGHLLLILKRDEEARAQANTAIDLDPMNPMVLGLSSMVLALTGEYEKAIAVGEQALSLAPGNSAALTGLYLAYLYKEEYVKALDPWMSTLSIDKQTSLDIRYVCEREGFPAAVSLLAEEYLNTGHVVPFDLALVYAAADNPSLAMDWIEKSYEDQDASVPYVGMNWFSREPFKIEDPRLIDLLEKMKLPPQEK